MATHAKVYIGHSLFVANWRQDGLSGQLLQPAGEYSYSQCNHSLLCGMLTHVTLVMIHVVMWRQDRLSRQLLKPAGEPGAANQISANSITHVWDDAFDIADHCLICLNGGKMGPARSFSNLRAS